MGKTRWTAIEERAIKDACFDGEWNRLFLLALDTTNEFPDWLPQTHVRYNLSDFGIGGAATAIKTRVLENSGRLKPMTAVKRAEVLRAENEHREARRRALSPQGEAGVQENIERLFAEIARQCKEVNATGHQEIRCGTGGERPRECVLTDGNVGMTIFWQSDRTMTNLGSAVARQFNDRLNVPSEGRRAVYVRPPQQVEETRYEPDLSRSLELGWKDPETKGVISTGDLASKCVISFLNLIERRNSGKMPRPRKYRMI